MSNSKDVVNKIVSQAHSECDPIDIIASCVKAMDHLKSDTDPKLNMSLGFLQSEISKALSNITFNY